MHWILVRELLPGSLIKMTIVSFGLKSSSKRNVLNHMASRVVCDVDMYYAYVVKSVIVDYLLLDHLIAPLVNRNKSLVVDL
jgi:hypothetical protein